MKKLISILLVFLSLTTVAQNKKLEAANKVNGKTVLFESGTRVKITTLDRKKFVGDLAVKDAETITVNGNDVALSNIGSIKNYTKGGRTAKNILYGVGAGLIVGSGVAGAAKSGSAFALFMGGTATAITGALVNNKHKTLVYRNYIFKVVE
ncbi:hypothetical protein EQG63_08695 [Flavobacterium amnicola]|jgi:hypothetical protein|uniref:Glycine zipper family protein n=1 Tax=Flavobacterium amnicola TaxID=2506422 RepID=A0A4Q1K204_9FLAO|nr:hypothetical protein [Flavobacterium amnicola]RXR18337.1 hypothetical protein EQG63_08695 [Flavobacterium amnicola]